MSDHEAHLYSDTAQDLIRQLRDTANHLEQREKDHEKPWKPKTAREISDSCSRKSPSHNGRIHAVVEARLEVVALIRREAEKLNSYIEQAHGGAFSARQALLDVADKIMALR